MQTESVYHYWFHIWRVTTMFIISDKFMTVFEPCHMNNKDLLHFRPNSMIYLIVCIGVFLRSLQNCIIARNSTFPVDVMVNGQMFNTSWQFLQYSSYGNSWKLQNNRIGLATSCKVHTFSRLIWSNDNIVSNMCKDFIGCNK